MLEVRNLAVQYGAHPALNDVSLAVDAGEIVVILGANGAGKSSLLKAIAGTSEGTVSGGVSLDGNDFLGTAPDAIVEMGIAFVPEGRGIFGDLPVNENLVLGAYSAHARRSQTANLAKVYELFPKLKERGSQIARTMSGGEQQMVAIGRAMMSDPKFLMLDEPSLGLSPLLCKELFANLSRVRETGIGVLMVEQNAKQSLAIADRGYLIENGSVVGENDARSMLSDPAVQAAYLGGAASSHAPAASSATNVPASEDSTTRTFISASGLAGGDIGQVSDQAIADMVTRASQTSQQSTTARPQTPHVSTRGEPAPATIPMQPEGPPDRDDDLQNLLRSMEESARNARLGSTSSQPAVQNPKPQSMTEREENLPKIPVYKKSTVEVFRRAPDGSMQRVKR